MEREINKRSFTLDNQLTFSKLSGDYNPLHLDTLLGRRLLFGSPVVYGIKMLLWALDDWVKRGKKEVRLAEINVDFIKPLNIGSEASLNILDSIGKSQKIEIISNGIVLIKIHFTWDYGNAISDVSIKSGNPKKINPKILDEQKIKSESGKLELYLNTKIVNQLFPDLLKFLPKLQIATLLATTRLVGTRCPGMFSLYSGFSLSFIDGSFSDNLKFKVIKYDNRFKLVKIQIKGPGSTGVIRSFIRPRQVKQSDYNSIAKNVKKHEFQDQSALIIGGTRGLGEVTAKLLAAGSADVKLSYYKGEKDAIRIVDDINLNGGCASFFQHNVLSPNEKVIENILNNWQPTHLYYFATPFIFSATRGKFSNSIYKLFCDYYITGFNHIMDILISYGLKNAYYPSSIALDEKPSDMQEYISAKLEGEALCTKFENIYNTIKIYKPRLPRIETDQTVSLFPVINQDPVAVQLKHLRIFRDGYEV